MVRKTLGRSASANAWQRTAAVLLLLFSCGVTTRAQGDDAAAAQAALERAGENRVELERALKSIPADQRPGLEFLVANMPDRDLKSLKAEFLLENCELAYRAWRNSPWKDRVPVEVFHDAVLPYANINERRDAWRKEFLDRFQPLVKDAKTPAEAAAKLNQTVFGEVKVKYSTGRPKADQSPFESMQAGLASCSGLAVLLVDACRAVGVPARFVGTPLWSDRSGNHSWVEIWDDGWHFTGAAEPAGDRLDQAWFVERASTARRDHPLHAIYAVSFRRTPLTFPLVWDRTIDYVHAVNVTDRYAGKIAPPAEGERRVKFRVTEGTNGPRVSAKVTVRGADGKETGSWESKDERFDANDHLTATLRDRETYEIEVRSGALSARTKVTVGPELSLVTIALAAPKVESPKLDALRTYLAKPTEQRGALAEQPFAGEALTRAEAEGARALLWEDHVARLRKERAAEMQAKVLTLGELKMPFSYKVFGQPMAGRRSLYISLHGGGGAPRQVNDQQWENQKILYEPAEGVYVAPRAPTDTWNLWHQEHIDPLFDRLIENLIVFENVDPNRVYLMGYSAGGDGVFQVAPRMADRFGAAAMMAGHPNESTPLGLRNLPFAIHMGGKDAAYNRNTVARQWGEQLDKLRQDDPEGYEHLTKIYPDKGHWMDREDASAVPWMAKFVRNPFPQRVVWRQDDVTEARFYWLAVPKEERKAGAEVIARRDGARRIDVTSPTVKQVEVRLADALLDLDAPLTITSGDKTLFAGQVKRTIGAIAESLAERGDPASAADAKVKVELP